MRQFSGVLYLVAIPLEFASPWRANAAYVLVALRWLIPDRHIERVLSEAGKKCAPAASREN